MDEKDLENINQIDMECEAPDDDDDFGGPIRTISATADDRGINIERNFNSCLEPDYEHINEIDMECEAPDDTDDSFGSANFTPSIASEIHEKESDVWNNGPKKTGTILDFGDDEDELLDKIKEAPARLDAFDADEVEEEHELVGESMKKQADFISQGEVESDYLKKLQKKHAKSNKKGAYNLHFHLAGNPQKEVELFNHDMGSDFENQGSTNITGTAEGSGAASSGEASCACSEAVEGKSGYEKTANEILTILGYEAIKNSDGSYTVIDDLNPDKDIICKDADELRDALAHDFDSCFILPLEIDTGLKFDSLEGWLDWYKENESDNNSLARDMNYIDVFVNHLSEIDF